MPRLHWFWRGALSVAVAMLFAGVPLNEQTLPGLISHSIHQVLPPAAPFASYPPRWASLMAISVAHGATLAIVALTAYGILTRCLGGRADSDGETHCRKCGYILRGITEPRCPECGEKI